MMLYHLSKCCMPIPGDPIVGSITRSRGVSVHRFDCPTLNDIPQERLMQIKWANMQLLLCILIKRTKYHK